MKDPVADAIPKTNKERIAMMKRRAEGFAEPLRSLVMDIPDDLDFTTPLRLGDFPCRDWDNRNGRVTLAGDSAHPMTSKQLFRVLYLPLYLGAKSQVEHRSIRRPSQSAFHTPAGFRLQNSY